jgi:hypothetical protein
MFSLADQTAVILQVSGFRSGSGCPDRLLTCLKPRFLRTKLNYVLRAIALPCVSIGVARNFRYIEAEAQMLRSYRACDVSQFAVTFDASESLTLTAT